MMNDDEFSMLTMINDPINFHYNGSISQQMKRTATTTTTTTEMPIIWNDLNEKNQCICRLNNENRFETYEILDELLRKNSVKIIKIHTHYYRKHLMHIFNGLFNDYQIKSKSLPNKSDSLSHINQTLSKRIFTVATSTMPTTINTPSQQPLSTTVNYHSLSSFNKPLNILKTINKAVQYGAPFMATAMLAKTLRLSSNSKLAHRSSWQHRKSVNQFPAANHDTALLLLNEKNSFPIFVVPEDLDYPNPEYLLAIPNDYPLR